MPDEAAALGVAPALRLVSTLDLPEDAFGRSNLIGAHHQQGVVCTEDRILQEHLTATTLPPSTFIKHRETLHQLHAMESLNMYTSMDLLQPVLIIL